MKTQMMCAVQDFVELYEDSDIELILGLLVASFGNTQDEQLLRTLQSWHEQGDEYFSAHLERLYLEGMSFSYTIEEAVWLFTKYPQEVCLTAIEVDSLNYKTQLARISGPTPAFSDFIGREDKRQ